VKAIRRVTSPEGGKAMVELLIVVALVVAFDLAAVRFGADSRWR
jgi:hypothetical protein